ncbi:hypothetical protein BLNAU_22382 [Blattamonas nauphoetae]|uniref:Uncharacterized protein n=1 Tax=Blattamonas nauphoetae TaxID=2049346 RepID=A0ABQ9WT92_9EUKA|nr:hypothetical protein BLNAU_22382 [Blattamonas nauphoetae]
MKKRAWLVPFKPNVWTFGLFIKKKYGKKPPTVQPPSSPTPVTLFVNNPKITRKLPHSQYLRVSNQPQYVETSTFRSQSPVEAVERTTLKESSTMHKCESSAGSHQISLCIRTSQESRVCVTSKRSSRREKR